MVSREEKELYKRLASLSGWDIAIHFGCGYSGDGSPIPHGGFFYDAGDWDVRGFAKVVDLWWDGEGKRMVIQQGTIHKPTSADEWESCWDFIGIGKGDAERSLIPAQIEAVRWGKGAIWGDARSFDLDTWHEWRIWRAVAPWLKALGA